MARGRVTSCMQCGADIELRRPVCRCPPTVHIQVLCCCTSIVAKVTSDKVYQQPASIEREQQSERTDDTLLLLLLLLLPNTPDGRLGDGARPRLRHQGVHRAHPLVHVGHEALDDNAGVAGPLRLLELALHRRVLPADNHHLAKKKKTGWGGGVRCKLFILFSSFEVASQVVRPCTAVAEIMPKISHDFAPVKTTTQKAA